ncbi:MAG: hypothetical protein JWO09_1881 [Bacteroidetes bacterium]|nr:hypothetical protein [Bacteroidota bacterium]
MRSEFDQKLTVNMIAKSAKQHFDEDEDESEETVC